MLGTGANKLTITSAQFTSSTAANSGGLFYFTGTTMLMTVQTMTATNTVATTGSGGVFYISGTSSTLSITSTSAFTTNTAG